MTISECKKNCFCLKCNLKQIWMDDFIYGEAFKYIDFPEAEKKNIWEFSKPSFLGKGNPADRKEFKVSKKLPEPIIGIGIGNISAVKKLELYGEGTKSGRIQCDKENPNIRKTMDKVADLTREQLKNNLGGSKVDCMTVDEVVESINSNPDAPYVAKKSDSHTITITGKNPRTAIEFVTDQKHLICPHPDHVKDFDFAGFEEEKDKMKKEQEEMREHQRKMFSPDSVWMAPTKVNSEDLFKQEAEYIEKLIYNAFFVEDSKGRINYNGRQYWINEDLQIQINSYALFKNLTTLFYMIGLYEDTKTRIDLELEEKCFKNLFRFTIEEEMNERKMMRVKIYTLYGKDPQLDIEVKLAEIEIHYI